MKYQPNDQSSSHLPVIYDLTRHCVLSLIVALTMTVVSLGGLLFPSAFYSTDEVFQTFVANDVVNLLIGTPILLGSMWLARSGWLVGLLLWPGALLYVVYNYIAYLFGIPLGLMTLLYLALVLLSAALTFALLKSIDRETVAQQLSGVAPEKAGGWVLVVFGVAFFSRAVGMIAAASMSQGILPGSEIGVLVADIVLSILWLTGGILLLRRKPLGYVSGLGLLFVGSMLFIGLIIFLLLQPVISSAPFVLVDVIAVLVMGLVCFIPTGYFMRGVLSKGKL
jgi:hypothetical protein